MVDVQLSSRGSTIKTAYEGQTNTNAFTDAAAAAVAALDTMAQEAAADYYTSAETDTLFAALDTDDIAEATNLYYTDERVDDRVAALIQNGTGISWAYSDVGGTLTPTVTITQYDDEMAQDAIGAMLVDGTTIDFTYTDATPALTAEVKDSSLTTSKLASPTGSDTNVVTGTAGTSGNLIAWDANGDAVDAGAAIADYYTSAEVDTLFSGLDADDIDDTLTTNKFTNASDISKLAGIEASAQVNTINSDPTGVTGADAIPNMMSLTTAEFAAIGTPDAATIYFITDAT